tara:strand:- start:438 stop:626 length:189 start_codon:yes stop_codon:yes gene_type:complete
MQIDSYQIGFLRLQRDQPPLIHINRLIQMSTSGLLIAFAKRSTGTRQYPARQISRLINGPVR